ncbi:sensor histidine kinase [Hyphomonas sp.]|uniref:sensor histidine kinase n=1 Tax=Hyphomonas sp. TaxID=87 RepID=UPI00391C4366
MSVEKSEPELMALGSTTRQYWLLQIAGWSAMALLSFLSLTIWYNPGEWQPAMHTLLQSFLGIFISHPLRWVATMTWSSSWLVRTVTNGAAVVAASLVWTAARLASFTWLTGEAIPPSDWGGWVFASVIVFGAWSFCYHALKYYRAWFLQRQFLAEARNEMLLAQASAREESFRRLEAEKHFRETQLRMLKYQLSPHFLLNALNSVSYLVHRDDKATALDMLARIGDFLRMSLEHHDELLHTLEEELTALQLYLGIERVRFGDRLQTEFRIDDAARSVLVPSLLLQPLVENSIKHALGRQTKPTLITVSAQVSGDRLQLTVQDDGPGPAGMSRSGSETGIGLLNVRQRLVSAYGDASSLEMTAAEPQGLIVSMSIPLVAEGAEGDVQDAVRASPEPVDV